MSIDDDDFPFFPHPMTCGKCGAEIDTARCPRCGYCEKPVGHKLAEAQMECERLREERDVSNRANEFLRGEEKRLRGERDEARRAAWLFLRCRPGTLAHLEAAKTYPWLDVEAAQAAGGEG